MRPGDADRIPENLLMMRCEPDGIHGYLVPFWAKDKATGKPVLTCVPVPSARGLMRMARSNGVTNLNIGIAREGEPFYWNIEDGKFVMGHTPGWDDDKKPIRGFTVSGQTRIATCTGSG